MMQASSFAAKLQPVALAAALLLAPAGAVLAQEIGRVQQTQGLVTLTRGASSQVVETGTDLQAGDVVETQAGSAAALRYLDGTQIQLGAGSRFTVSQFNRQPERVQEENFTGQLLKGAMRVVTGSIAQRRQENFRMTTSTATIGIRGTDFSVRICADDCRVAEGPQVASSRLPELAGRVGAVSGNVIAIDERGLQRTLNASSAVRPGDLLITGSSGIAVVVLTDGTRIALDPNSRFWIAAYEFDSARPQGGRIALELIQGAAQFNSGQLAKLRPERFAFLAGDQWLRFHGTWGAAVVNAVASTFNDGKDKAEEGGQQVASNVQNAGQTVVNTVTNQTQETNRTIVTTTQQTVANTNAQANQLTNTVVGQFNTVVQQGQQQTQQQGQQLQQTTQQTLQNMGNALPSSPPAKPTGPAGPGYDISGGRVGLPVGQDSIAQGRFNTVITGQTTHPIDNTWIAINTTEVIVPPTQVRTAGGLVLTGGTILRHIERNTVTGAETVYVSFVGLSFEPSPQTLPRTPARMLTTACGDCTGLAVHGSMVIPSEMEKARLLAQAQNQVGGRGTVGGGGQLVYACNESSGQCEELRRERTQQQQNNQRSTRSSTGAPVPAPAPAPAAPPPAPAPAPAQPASTVSLFEGAVTSYSRNQPRGQFIAAGQVFTSAPAPAAQGVSNPRELPQVTGLRRGSLPFVAPPLSTSNMSVDMTRLFGADVIRTQGGAAGAVAEPGVYVHVEDGAIALAQAGQEVVIGRGETALAPAGGGTPTRVLRGVRVTAPALRDALRIAALGQCSADPSSALPPAISAQMVGWGGQVTMASEDLRDLRWVGDLTSKLNEIDTKNATSGESGKGLGNRWGVGFENAGLGSAFDQARGNDLKGAGGLQGPTNIVGGRHRDTFMGNKINNASGQDVTLGGKPGRVGNIGGSGGKVSTGVEADPADVKAAVDGFNKEVEGAVADMMKMEGIRSSGNFANDVAELGYALSVGRDTYAATKNMNTAERQNYLERAGNSQRLGGRPREDDCASCGGSPMPIFLSLGQFQNDLAAMGRAIISAVQKAGGTGDGRGDKDSSSSSNTSGVMMSRLVQLGGLLAAAGGELNVDEALKMNRLVQPGAQ